MVFICLRVAEFILLNFLPSLICSFFFSNASDAMANVISLFLFILFVSGIIFLGYKFMAATGNRRAYFKTTRLAYAVFVVVALSVFLIMGEEGCKLLTNGLLVFTMSGVSAGVSVFISLILLFLCTIVPGYVFKEQDDFYTFVLRGIYKDVATQYRVKHRRGNRDKRQIVENIVKKENEPTSEELHQWEEHEKKRSEYEKRFSVVKPAKFTENDVQETEEEIIARKNLEKEARLQQYFITESKKKERPPVDKEAELKKAHELENAMNERRYHSNYRRHSHHEAKEVDKEAEMKKARELKIQLEFEEAQRMQELRRKR